MAQLGGNKAGPMLINKGFQGRMRCMLEQADSDVMRFYTERQKSKKLQKKIIKRLRNKSDKLIQNDNKRDRKLRLGREE